MAHLWFYRDARWTPVLLSGPVLALSPDGLRPLERFDDAPAWLRAVGGDWALLAARQAIAINGSQPGCGLRVLRDRDELRFADSSRVFFSTERLASVHPFAGAKPICCPRCRQPVEPGSEVVTCPACGAISHQTEKLPCWVYAPTCPLCPQPTPLTAGYQWTPEEL